MFIKDYDMFQDDNEYLATKSSEDSQWNKLSDLEISDISPNCSHQVVKQGVNQGALETMRVTEPSMELQLQLVEGLSN